MKFELLMAEAKDSASLTPARVAGLALELSSVYAQVTEALEPLKEQLREIASTSGENPSIIDGLSLDGEILGTVMVTFPDKQVKLARNANIEALKELLGDSFSDYFETAVTYKPKKDLPQILAPDLKMSSTRTRAILEAVEYSEPTPRVGFKPLAS